MVLAADAGILVRSGCLALDVRVGMVQDAPVVVQQQVPWLGRAMLGSTMDPCSASSRVAFGRIS